MLSSGEERISNALKNTKYNPNTNQFEPVPETSQENESSLSVMKIDASKNSSNKDDSYNNPTTVASKTKGGRWTAAEHQRFLDSLRIFGKDWYRVEEYIGTRSSAQIRSHAQKFISKLEKDPDPQYDDIMQILDINLRLLKKTDRDPDGHGPRVKPATLGIVNAGTAQKADTNTEQRQSHNLHPHHAHNRGSQEQPSERDIYKEEYTLLPSQMIFAVEKMNPYERDEKIKQL